MTRSWFRVALSAIAIAIGLSSISAVAATPPPKSGIFAGVEMYATIRNTTNREAWVDFSSSMPTLPWRIVSAFCLRPGEERTTSDHVEGPTILAAQFRVRAEIKHGDCRSGNLATTSWDQSVGLSPSRLIRKSLSLTYANGRYIL